ncbi:MAG TPA: hypothetical protein VMM76_27140 [Pirellulaceae bacterium]|nr:hypothetical protein [Pirellulaceae bacterium]
MTGLSNCCSVVVAVSMLLSLNPAYGDDRDGPEKDTDEVTQQFVDGITMLGIREDGTRYRVKQPHLLMKFYDPQRGRNLDRTQTGALWAWGDGRPIALTEVWRWGKDTTWGHTLISTTPGYVTASVDEMTWGPEQPGLHFTEMQNAATPASTFRERTGQMSQLAERFTGYEMVRRKVVDLSVLPEPLYRYEEEGIDGAIFALAQCENPTAILFLEAVSDPIRPDYWRYAWAKGTSSPVTVEQDGDELLHIPGSLNDLGSASESFWVFFRSNADLTAKGEEEEALQLLEGRPATE